MRKRFLLPKAKPEHKIVGGYGIFVDMHVVDAE
jgi:hypothetical protein